MSKDEEKTKLTRSFFTPPFRCSTVVITQLFPDSPMQFPSTSTHPPASCDLPSFYSRLSLPPRVICSLQSRPEYTDSRKQTNQDKNFNSRNQCETNIKEQGRKPLHMLLKHSADKYKPRGGILQGVFLLHFHFSHHYHFV